MTRLAGGTELSYENLIKFKILALLHDPPHKALLLSRRIRRNETISGSLAHEAEVKRILDFLATILGGAICYSKHRKIKSSDRVASSFDRWEIDKLRNIRSYFGSGLVNIFDPLIEVRLNKKLKYYTSIRENLLRFINELKIALHKGISENLEEDKIMLLHLFETLLEPLWYNVFNEIVNPADTRAPTHSVFDHLYATASTVNIVAPAKDRETVAGLLVGVSIAPLRDWIASSRKLSDLWISSWLASVMVWYTVKDLVWCLGPDILLLPGFRWNQLYYALLKEKLGDLYGIIREFVEGFGFFEGFPYYAWQPALQVLFLPIIRSNNGLEGSGGSECTALLKRVLYTNINESLGALEDVRRRVENYLIDRFSEAWRLVLEVVRENAPGRLGELIDRLIELGVLEEPPLQPIIVVEKLYVSDKRNYMDAKKVYAEVFNELMARIEEREAQALPGWARNEKLHAITKRMGTPICPGLTGRADKEIETYRWRSCSVCKHAPAVLWVPGRDLPNGEVSEEYREWARRTLCSGNGEKDIETCWRMWRPVFKPGERLCPYCLVKRLLGLNSVFEKLGEKLLRLKPRREVSFPSTSDVAGLALKIALLRLASMIVSGEVKVDGIDEEIIDSLAVMLARSKIHRDLYETLRRAQCSSREYLDKLISDIKRLVDGRWWTPRLLWINVRELWKTIEDKIRGNEYNSVECQWIRFAAAVLLFVDSELEEALYNNTSAQEALKKLNRILGNAEVASNELFKTLRAIREALSSPRKYYSIIWFDGDKYGLLKRGILGLDLGKEARDISVYDYLKKIYKSVYEASVSRVREGTRAYNKINVSKEMMEKYVSGELVVSQGLVELCKEGKIPCGSIIVSPSYHYALANAISYTSLRAAIVSERLGGIPVYMAGDEGLIIAPTWLPWELLPPNIRTGYRREVLRALERVSTSNDELLEYISSNPALTVSLLVRRIYWASSSKYPGFHPVKKRGAGGVVYWRIPAIVSNGLSMGIRFAHYRDIMYDELWLTRYLLEEAKSPHIIEHVWFGDSVVLSYGRPGYALLRARTNSFEGVHVKIPYTLRGARDRVEEIRRTGEIYALSNILLGLVEKGVISTSIFTDRELLFGGSGKAEELWRKASQHGLPHIENLLYYLFKRNIQVGREQRARRYLEEIIGLFHSTLEPINRVDGSGELLETIVREVFRASHNALKSMRTL